jgi:CRISPR-associated endonuclease/helicase Cas3
MSLGRYPVGRMHNMTPEISNSLSHPTLQLWAKSDRGKESDAWHPLICHLLDVAASCLEIIELEPPRYGQLLAKDFAMSETEAVALTAALVGLHRL